MMPSNRDSDVADVRHAARRLADHHWKVDHSVAPALARLLEGVASAAVEDAHEHADGPSWCPPETCTLSAAVEVAHALLRRVDSAVNL